MQQLLSLTYCHLYKFHFIYCQMCCMLFIADLFYIGRKPFLPSFSFLHRKEKQLRKQKQCHELLFQTQQWSTISHKLLFSRTFLLCLPPISSSGNMRRMQARTNKYTCLWWWWPCNSLEILQPLLVNTKMDKWLRHIFIFTLIKVSL